MSMAGKHPGRPADDGAIRARALDALLAQSAESDPVAIRGAHLAELDSDRRRWLSEVTEAFDLLLEALADRAGAIARGEVKPPEPEVEPAPPEAASTTSEVSAPATVPDTPAVDDDEDLPEAEPITDPELSAAEADDPAAAAESTSFGDAETGEMPRARLMPDDASEAPTQVVEALDDAAIAAALAAQDAEPPPPATEAAPPPTPARPIDSEAKTIVEMPMVTDEAIEAHLAAQVGPPPPPTAALPDDDDDEPAAIDNVTPGWTRQAELLFEDTLRLFRLGDSDGALISLERLLTSIELNDDLMEFVRVNEERLLQLYHAVLGPWTRIPRRVEPSGPTMPTAFFKLRKVSVILRLIDDKTSIGKIMDSGTMSRLEAVATVSQLIRSRSLVMDEAG